MTSEPELPADPPHQPPPAIEPTVIEPDAVDPGAAETLPPDESLGGWLPSRPADVAADDTHPPLEPLKLEPGARLCEFVVERVLGRGGFGVVYLARQTSLDRQVALKVVPRAGGRAAEEEGRSLARLEHDHIVPVYSEMTEPFSGARLLCMQYVAGTNLATIIRELQRFESGRWNGPDLLAVLDSLELPPALFDPAAMRDREFLASADHVEAVCRIGEQLARALAHAHERDVLHRDVKPANVLFSRYGRPLLADFNLATRESDREASQVVGGTLAYMAPEHLDAFRHEDKEDGSPVEAVDARSDLYALSVLLWELASGRHPFPIETGPIETSQLSIVLRELAARRRTIPPESPPPDRRLRDLLLRGMAADPQDRYASAAEFAETIAGLRAQRTALRQMPPPDRTTIWAWRYPVAALILGALLPQIVGSVLQISYNAIRIVGELTPAQKELFPLVVLVYNVVAYPACLSWLGVRLFRVLRVWKRLRHDRFAAEGRGFDRSFDDEVDQARRRALELPRDTAIAACLGWFPGAVLFPLALHFGAGRLPAEGWMHFAISFALAGLIAVTYSFFFGLGIVLRTMYLRFWSNPRGFRERARAELANVPDRLRAVNVLAGLIPLAGAVVMVLVSPRGVTGGEHDAFRFLTASLILAGMAGYAAVGRLTRRYQEVVAACTGGEVRRRK